MAGIAVDTRGVALEPSCEPAAVVPAPVVVYRRHGVWWARHGLLELGFSSPRLALECAVSALSAGGGRS